MRYIRPALDAVCTVALLVGCVALALSVCWELAAIVGGLLGMLIVTALERGKKRR